MGRERRRLKDLEQRDMSWKWDILVQKAEADDDEKL